MKDQNLRFSASLCDPVSSVTSVPSGAVRALAFIAGLVLVSPGGGPSVEDMFVATTQAAAETEGTMCLMPDGDDDGLPEAGYDRPDGGRARAGHYQDDALADSVVSGFSRTEQNERQLTIPTSSNEGGDLPPVRMVVDPYPSFNGVAVDATTDLVLMSDTNRKSLLVYDRMAGSATSQAPASPRRQIMGPDTGVGFVAGVAIDPVHRELFTVNNDVEDRLVAFDYDDRGNVKPKRLLYVPHQSWGIAFAPKRDVLALSVQTPNMFVVFKRDAKKFDAPLRSVRGPKTQMADPHGIYFDETHNEVVVANHGNFRPRELITSYTAYDARESRQERSGSQFNENARGRFLASSITVFDGDATGDVAPLRVVQGPLSQIDWPMGVAVDEINNEIIVANNGDHSVLVFPRTANGDVPPKRVLRGPLTGIKGPMGVAIAKDEIWIANFGDHSAVVFPRLAAGNVRPRRIVRNAPAGKDTSGFGNPYAVAYDSKRQEILVPN
jgi:DNA-binding beta-propeller fold protein YncE